MIQRPIVSVDYIIVHCSKTHSGLNIGRTELDRQHRKLGYFGIGYHFVIRRDGCLLPAEYETEN